MPSRQRDRNRPRSVLPEAGRKTHGPASAASLPRSRSNRLADRPPAPSPFRKSRSVPASHGINETRLRQRAALMSAFKMSGALFRSAPADGTGRRRDAQGRRQDLKTPVEQALMRGLGT